MLLSFLFFSGKLSEIGMRFDTRLHTICFVAALFSVNGCYESTDENMRGLFPPTAAITGITRDANTLQAVPNALVSISDPNENVLEVFSDSLGKYLVGFEVSNSNLGDTVRLTCSHSGHRTAETLLVMTKIPPHLSVETYDFDIFMTPN